MPGDMLSHADAAARAGRLLSSKEVSAIFGVSVSTLTRWRVEGKISFVRLPGGTVRFRFDQVRAICDAQYDAAWDTAAE